MALSRSGRSGRSDLLWCTRGAVVEHHRDLGEVVEGQRASAIEVCKPRQHRFDRKRDALFGLRRRAPGNCVLICTRKLVMSGGYRDRRALLEAPAA